MKKIPIRQISKTVREPGLSGNFNIRDLAALLSGKDMVQELHRHDFFFLLLLEKGKGKHVIDFNPYPAGDHSVFCMRPGQVHQLTLHKDSTGFLMEFDPGFYSPREKPARQVFRKASNKNFCLPGTECFRRLYSTLAYIFDEHSSKKEHYQEIIRANLDIFFIELTRQSKGPGHIPGKDNPYAQERLEELLELFDTHIIRIKQPAQYAAMMHLSAYQLNAITKETMGKTTSELINEHILLEAKRQLLATSSQVNQVADNLGYEDVSYFIRFFKKQTGHTPETFRQNFS